MYELWKKKIVSPFDEKIKSKFDGTAKMIGIWSLDVFFNSQRDDFDCI